MPNRRKPSQQGIVEKPLELPEEFLKRLIDKPITQEQLSGVLMQLKKAVIERAMKVEMQDHLGYANGDEKPHEQANQRNGISGKTVLTDDGPVRIDVPRDRDGSFSPKIIGKHQRRFAGFDDKILSMYARGMTVREIQGHLQEIYGAEVSPDLISKVTDEVALEVKAWQDRPLDPMYPVVFFDALRVKIRDGGIVSNKAVYLALAIAPDGTRHVLGLWIEQTEGAKFWLKVFNELRNRGVNDILIAVVDGLKGLPEAIEAVFPQTTVQTCIVHLIRNSLNYATFKDRKALATALKPIYTAPSAEAAHQALTEFAQTELGQRYASVVQAWQRAWERVIPFFTFAPEIRKIIYTTNAIESLNMQLRKIIKNRGHFPSDEAATKLIWLALRNIMADKMRSVLRWKAAMNQFAIVYGDRFTREQY
jgi:putative transposase